MWSWPQQAVPDKGSEIPALRELLAAIDVTDVVVTADALHCQRATAQWITGQGGHYVLTVKANQPGLLADLKALPWAQVPAHTYVQTGRGRRTRRTVKTLEVPAWVDWPGAAQVVQARRTRTINGRRHIEVVYAIASVPMTRAQPRTVASWIQGQLRHRELLALGARRHLRRGPPPTTCRCRTPTHGHPAHHRHQPAQTPRMVQHRRRATTSRPRQPTPDHPPRRRMIDSAEALELGERSSGQVDRATGGSRLKAGLRDSHGPQPLCHRHDVGVQSQDRVAELLVLDS